MLPALGASSSEGSFKDIKMTPVRDRQAESLGELRADAKEAAQILRIEPMVSMLRKARSEGSSSARPSRSVQHARMLCLWKLSVASQEVRKVSATIDFEIAKSAESLDQLSAKRDMAINMINTLNFMQGGILGTIKQSTSFPTHPATPTARQTIAMVSFSTGTAMAMSTLFVPSLWSRELDSQPNILAHVFDANFKPDDADRSYLWRFMTSPIPGSADNIPRRAMLIKHWEALTKLNSADERRLRLLAAKPNDDETLKETIRVVSQRMDLLHDLRTHIEEFDTSLYELHKAITFADTETQH